MNYFLKQCTLICGDMYWTLSCKPGPILKSYYGFANIQAARSHIVTNNQDVTYEVQLFDNDNELKMTINNDDDWAIAILTYENPNGY
jgi:hypothetical protein